MIRCLYKKTYNSVGTSHLLADHESDSHDGTLSVSGNGPHLLEEDLGGGVTNKASLESQLLRHFADLVGNELVLGGQAKYLLVIYSMRVVVDNGLTDPRILLKMAVARSQSSCLAHQRGLSGETNMPAIRNLFSCSSVIGSC